MLSFRPDQEAPPPLVMGVGPLGTLNAPPLGGVPMCPVDPSVIAASAPSVCPLLVVSWTSRMQAACNYIPK